VSAPSSTAAEASAFRSWIDYPAGETLASRRLVVRGWCYHRGGERIAAIRLRIGERVFPGLYGQPRPDVSAAFGAEAGSDVSGYEIPTTVGKSVATGFIEARMDRGGWQPVQPVQFRIAGGSAWAEWLTWSKFWLAAYAGRPNALAALTPAQREFALVTIRQRGWFNLQLAPQYPPRPVAPESFRPSSATANALPSLAVVTPSFNQAPFLEATLRSVLEQRDVNLSYIVQDGGSADGSVDIIRRHASRLTHWESVPDHGQADAIVRGFRHATLRPDDLMMYLNSDDLLAPGAARFVAEFFRRHPEVDVVYGHRILIDEAGQEIGRWYSPRQRCDDLQLHDLVPQETFFWRKRVWDRVGGIDPDFHFAMDWDLLLRFAAAGAKFVRVPHFLGLFRLHGQQKSQAQLHQRGIPEMDRLRLRSFGQAPAADILHASMQRAQLDSAMLLRLWQWGIKV